MIFTTEGCLLHAAEVTVLCGALTLYRAQKARAQASPRRKQETKMMCNGSLRDLFAEQQTRKCM